MQPYTTFRHNMLKVILAFACVYLFWGSAFVAIRYSVQMVHPALVAGIRYITAGFVLLIFLFARGKSLKLTQRDFWRVLGLGLLMFTCNTVLLNYGGRVLPAGLTALLISTIPLFIALLEALLPGGTGVTLPNGFGIITGFAGMSVLLQCSFREGLLPHGAKTAAVCLLTAAFAWALGSVLLSRMVFQSPLLVCVCWQMLIGGTIDILIGLGTGGYRSSQWSPGVWLSLIFLAIFGTLAGYTSYSFLLRNVPISSATTYAYVNPLVAVLLGWLLLHEPLTGGQWLGLTIVLGSVAVVVSFPLHTKPATRKELDPSRF